MAKFILRRLLWVIPVMLGVVLIVFTIDRVGPGDPVAAALGGTYTQEQYDAKEAELGLDRPSPIYRESSPGEIWVTPSRPVCR